MKILVIGGNKFVGRVFIMQACQNHEIYMLNRGSHHEIEIYGIKDPILNMVHEEYLIDRHDKDSISNIKVNFDVVVDFCAYKQNDIKLITDSLLGIIGKYIFVSTSDVYKRFGSITKIKDENTEFNYDTKYYPSELKDYINGKVILEHELKEECTKKKIDYISVRPSIIYGPYNYAPRENIYIKSIIEKGKAIFPRNATGKFQFIYVKDVANAIQSLCELDDSAHSYNLCSSDILDYQKFSELLLNVVDVPCEDFYYDVKELKENNYFLPFPYSLEQTELCDGSRVIKDTKISYTPHQEGIQKTYNAFKHVYSK